mmetsp:Transcript_6187/g.18584  ORF Transcript_6187/g.18584 Transcript_6187/m.18584 type:complete len:338 (+) Transcript_6187:361-1374(+)
MPHHGQVRVADPVLQPRQGRIATARHIFLVQPADRARQRAGRRSRAAPRRRRSAGRGTAGCGTAGRETGAGRRRSFGSNRRRRGRRSSIRATVVIAAEAQRRLERRQRLWQRQALRLSLVDEAVHSLDQLLRRRLRPAGRPPRRMQQPAAGALLASDHVQDVVLVRAPEASGRLAARQRHQQRDAETVRVRLGRVLVRVEEVRVREAGRVDVAGCIGRHGHRPARPLLGETDIGEEGAVDAPLATSRLQRQQRSVEQDVGRLHVAVENAVRMEVHQRPRRVAERRESLRPRQARSALEALLQPRPCVGQEQEVVIERSASHERRHDASRTWRAAIAE